jgi:hypothetical protein
MNYFMFCCMFSPEANSKRMKQKTEIMHSYKNVKSLSRPVKKTLVFVRKLVKKRGQFPESANSVDKDPHEINPDPQHLIFRR